MSKPIIAIPADIKQVDGAEGTRRRRNISTPR